MRYRTGQLVVLDGCAEAVTIADLPDGEEAAQETWVRHPDDHVDPDASHQLAEEPASTPASQRCRRVRKPYREVTKAGAIKENKTPQSLTSNAGCASIRKWVHDEARSSPLVF